MGLGIEIFTSADKKYTATVDIATMIIRTIDDLNAMAAYGKANATAHTGYYILGCDIDGDPDEDGTYASVNVLSQWCGGGSCTTDGFRGIFDGRGHTIRRIDLGDHGLFDSVGKSGVIKNLAVKDVKTTIAAAFLHGELQGGTVDNVYVEADTESAIGVTGSSAVIKNSVFVLKSGKRVVGTAGAWGDRQTTFTNLAIIVGTPTAGKLENGAENFAGLIGTHYVAGSYETFKQTNNIVEAATANDMLTLLGANNAISSWNSDYIAYDSANKAITFNGTAVLTVTE